MGLLGWLFGSPAHPGHGKRRGRKAASGRVVMESRSGRRYSVARGSRAERSLKKRGWKVV